MREKLIELLETVVDPVTVLAYGEVHVSTAKVADHLIANGVTIATDNNVGSKWIPVSERLPIEEAKAHEQEWCEEYCEFLVVIERGLLPTTLYYDWEENEWFRINTALERETYKVTHWMPMPQPPKGE